MSRQKDPELERLGDLRDAAYHDKQSKWQAKDYSWKECCRLREAMNEAFNRQQKAYGENQTAWDFYKRQNADYSQKIEFWDRAQQKAYENMKYWFEQASAAHNNKDGAAAKSYSEKGHEYKAEAQSATRERRTLVNQAQEMRYRCKPSGTELEALQHRFKQAKAEYDMAMKHHRENEEEFKAANEYYKQIRHDFDKRLTQLKEETAKRQRIVDDKSTLYARFRTNHSPISKIPAKVFYDRNHSGSYHLTMKYDDGYRVSWDATDQGDMNFHWTNERLPKRHPDRNKLPGDASKY